MLDIFKIHSKKQLFQWEPIVIVNEALNQVEKVERSFIWVNMCPFERKPFIEWVRKHVKSVKAADSFFKHRTSLFDTMPAAWLYLSEPE